MKLIKFDRAQDIPVINAKILGATDSAGARLVFDTGTGLSQFDTALMEELGYTASIGLESYQTRGPAGEAVNGFTVRVRTLLVFGKRFENLTVGVIDFENFSHFGISGLLGFDVIKSLHLEMNGPKGLLKVH